MRNIFLLLVVVFLFGCKTLDVGGPECPMPNLTPPEQKVYLKAFRLMGNDPHLCGDVDIDIYYYDIYPIPECNPNSIGCVRRQWEGRHYSYRVNIYTKDPTYSADEILLHEFGHIMMWRVGWHNTTHHERMGRLGFKP